MVRAKTKKKQEFLSPAERIELESQQRDLQNTLDQAEGYGKEGQGIDKANIQREINRIGAAIAERTPEEARGAQKDKLVKEEKELEDKISEGMPTWYEMRQPTKNPGAVRKHINWNERNLANIERYREIQRILRPGNPKSIEALRKDK